jgi:tight adherence protein C
LVDKAGKADVQMFVPMVLLILPVTVIFAIYSGLQALQFGF